MAYSRDLAVMDYHGLSWTVMDCHGLSWTVMDKRIAHSTINYV